MILKVLPHLLVANELNFIVALQKGSTNGRNDICFEAIMCALFRLIALNMDYLNILFRRFMVPIRGGSN